MAQINSLRPSTGAIAAGARTGNILLGTIVQYPGVPSMVNVSATLAAAAAGDGLMQLTIGGRVVTGPTGLLVPTELAAGRGPDAQLGWLYSGPAMGDELLELIFINQDTVNPIAAPGITTLIQVVPVA